ncbi:MAG: HEAT repeat domain-containing protein [Candidatus Omnitrophica bacterium]|nr:HEAT repeat domain-containing protein [Candidatus Omnitrophota bacterium]
MQTKTHSGGQLNLARFLGAAVKGVEKEFNYLFPAGKNVPRPASEKIPVVKKESCVGIFAAKLAAQAKVAAPAPAPVSVPVPEPVVEPVVTIAPVAVPAPRVAPIVVVPQNPVAEPAPVSVKKVVSHALGLEGIAFASKAEEVESEIYFKDLQSSSRATRLKALREIKKISSSAAAAMLERLLVIEKDTLQVIEILNALASVCEDVPSARVTFKDFTLNHDAGIRLAALRAISKYRDEESFSILSGHMKDKDAEVRRQMLNCLCWTFSERCLPFAINALHDADPGVRKAAAQIVGALKAIQAISGLITLLSDPDNDVQASAAASLKKITGEDFRFKATATKQGKQDAVEAWRFWWRENQTRYARAKA